jgi:hypothetical protein
LPSSPSMHLGCFTSLVMISASCSVVGTFLPQDEVSILDGLVSKVLADIDLLGSLAAADNIVSTFNACRVVLVHRRRAILGEVQPKNCQVLGQSPEVGSLLGISAIAPS